MSTERWLVIALFAAMSLVAGLFLTGCELNGEYEDDDVQVRFGNTNGAVKVEQVFCRL